MRLENQGDAIREPPVSGGPIGCRSPPKRGPYSMPIHSRSPNAVERIRLAALHDGSVHISPVIRYLIADHVSRLLLVNLLAQLQEFPTLVQLRRYAGGGLAGAAAVLELRLA